MIDKERVEQPQNKNELFILNERPDFVPYGFININFKIM
jgi:hypothetical protein